jgi:hypothetical protein
MRKMSWLRLECGLENGSNKNYEGSQSQGQRHLRKSDDKRCGKVDEYSDTANTDTVNSEGPAVSRH